MTYLLIHSIVGIIGENSLYLDFTLDLLILAAGIYSMLAVITVSKYFRGRLLELSLLMLATGSLLIVLNGVLLIMDRLLSSTWLERISGYVIVLPALMFTILVSKMRRYLAGIRVRIEGEEMAVDLDSPIRMFLDVARNMDQQIASKLARTIGIKFAEKHRSLLESDPTGLSKVVDLLKTHLGAKLYIQSGVGVGELVFETTTARCPEWKLRLAVELLTAFWEEAVAISHKIAVIPRVRYVVGAGIIRVIISG